MFVKLNVKVVLNVAFYKFLSPHPDPPALPLSYPPAHGLFFVFCPLPPKGG